MEDDKKPIEGEHIPAEVGRPTKFKKEMIQTMLSIMENGGEAVDIMVALRISKATFYRWLQNEAEFKEAYEFGLLTSEQWWKNFGKMGLAGPQVKQFNTNLYLAFMQKYHGWKDKVETVVTNNVFIGNINVDQLKNLSAADLDKELKLRLEKLNPPAEDVIKKDDVLVDKDE